MTDHVVSFGLTLADPHIPWPARGSGGTELADREGWERRVIPATRRGEPTTIQAACRGDLAVNVMMDDEGFAISLAETGLRISCGGAVFAQCDAAMDAAEAMMAACDDWTSLNDGPFSARQKAVLGEITDAAERRGDILLDRVYPS